MDIVAIERVSFDSFRKKLEQIISLADNTSLSSSDMCIEKEWIEGKTLAASLNIFLRTLHLYGRVANFLFRQLARKYIIRLPKYRNYWILVE